MASGPDEKTAGLAMPDEKGSETFHEGAEYSDNSNDPNAHLTPAERAEAEKKLLRKLDWKLLPWLTFLYLISFLDRTNIGNAKVDGLVTDLKMTNDQYNLSLSVFFVSYAIFEPLTNVLLKQFRPSLFLPSIMMLWGLVMVTMGLVNDFKGLAIARFFLGLAEAGLFPGVMYYLSCWYKKSEYGIRSAIFFSAAAFAGSFGGLLAYGIAKLRGVGGKPGWAWIFILEGLFTILVGILSFWMVHDFPDDAKFLTPDERARVLHRLHVDGNAIAHDEKIEMTYFWASVKDWKTWAFSAIYMGVDVSLYAFSLFVPTIISELGYAGPKANLLSVPPYAFATVATILAGWYADRTSNRGLTNLIMSPFTLVGMGMLLGSSSAKVKYAGVYFAAVGVYPCVPNTISWASNNLEGVFKRGITLGIVIGWGNLNGIVSSNIYRQSDAPGYKRGHGIFLAYAAVFTFGGSVVTSLLLRRENKLREQGKRDHWTEGKSPQEVRRLGDKVPEFRYVL